MTNRKGGEVDVGWTTGAGTSKDSAKKDDITGLLLDSPGADESSKSFLFRRKGEDI